MRKTFATFLTLCLCSVAFAQVPGPNPIGGSGGGGGGGSGNPLFVSDAQNGPYGQTGAAVTTDPTPGGSAVSPGRSFHVACPASATPASGYTTVTMASGKTALVNLASGAMFDAGWQVVQVGTVTPVSGTLSGCLFQNIN